MEPLPNCLDMRVAPHLGSVKEESEHGRKAGYEHFVTIFCHLPICVTFLSPYCEMLFIEVYFMSEGNFLLTDFRIL